MTRANLDEMLRSETRTSRRLLGVPPAMAALGLDQRWAYNVITAVGNYGEIFERHLGASRRCGCERGINALWTQGGLMYAIRRADDKKIYGQGTWEDQRCAYSPSRPHLPAPLPLRGLRRRRRPDAAPSAPARPARLRHQHRHRRILAPDAQGVWRGFDVDVCRAVAAAVSAMACRSASRRCAGSASRHCSRARSTSCRARPLDAAARRRPG